MFLASPRAMMISVIVQVVNTGCREAPTVVTLMTTWEEQPDARHAGEMQRLEETMPGVEAAIREQLESRSAAMGAKDIEWLMSLYSNDIVYFDLVPPLRYVGSNALRERFLDWFPRWSGPIGQELGQLDVAAGDAVAAAWMLIRARGILKTGAKVDYWVRVSNAFRRAGDRWTITHEHVSLPVDMRSRTAVLNLTP
ncbi:nuclear transport factor 2 family protein [Mesorhizobium sp. AA22]|uniref:YybH family protein n=1 Tax=Mesorhizobium sp. AA22 TaxID=1854057 RepID=UPI001397874D|nr:nuclear transport factor 2 family protein [Mesorhizobium sp. AA22]QIA22299.1 DUF4440 domain-containing protein [Mesorhizobium sp. AA22]